jgi:hypothetical protein
MVSAPGMPEDVYAPLCSAIGSVVINWSLAECALDICGVIIFHAAGGRHEDKRLPRGLSTKLEFLERCFKKIESLNQFRAEATSVFEAAKYMSRTRNFLIHGMLSDFEIEHPWTIKFVNMDLIEKNTKYQEKILNITIGQIAEFGDDSARLAGDAQRLAELLRREFMADDRVY